MKLPEPPRREPEENVIPMINIVFLLLIFFMVAGTLEPDSPLSVDPADSEQGAELVDEPLRVLIDAEGQLAVDQDVVDNREQLLERLKTALKEAPERPVEVKADADADSARLLDVMDDLREAGAERMQLITRREH
ncbi:ExbD/TolR family protein [Halorhodospira halophila]|uniref:Outer membrane transport energization protein ExbD n=1 Tax=Halorhodospira halophila (strain DSM 244 / SL1) TaxID=349124 RepID=A1WU78_HALHL|nr:biopolymer transporter ExbD [Halorhodospira halophila]ABM61240.1 outer membrane transport energization protein ExbD [Halorhodospira halophila SL1]MBK1730028.1 biopolymer transporter ExbD [Halorhodospira halophila]